MATDDEQKRVLTELRQATREADSAAQRLLVAIDLANRTSQISGIARHPTGAVAVQTPATSPTGPVQIRG